MTRKERGNFAVVDFDQYMLRCDYRHKKNCMTYSREENVACKKDNCPFVLYFFDEMLIDEKSKTPYKPSYVA